MRRVAASLLAVMASVAACGGIGGAASPGPTEAPPVQPAGPTVTCGGGDQFPAELLRVEGRAHTEGDPAAAALRAFLAGPEGQFYPAESWTRVTETANRVQFVGRDGIELYLVAFELNGTWQLASSGGCMPELALPEGVTRAEWRIDPAFPAPDPAADSIHVLLTERACASGRPPLGRVLDPQVTSTAEAVTIVLLVRSLPGGQDCQGNPEFPFEVPLSEPLGDRRLLDGALFPPQPVLAPRDPAADYLVDCGPMEEPACKALVARIVEAARAEHRGKRIVTVNILDLGGSHEVAFDDGTGFSAVIN